MAPTKRCSRRFVGSRDASLLLLLLLTSCSNELLTLGKQVVAYHFGAPRLVIELVTANAENGNPTLTGDLLEIFFTSNRGGDSDVWTAKRPSKTGLFGTPTEVLPASSTSRETSSAISKDGHTLWVASDRPGGLGDLDIWSNTRPDLAGPWSAATNVARLNSVARDLPRPLGQYDLAMPMASDRGSPTIPGVYRTMIAFRPTTASEFSVQGPIPDLVPLEGSVDGCLTEDGLSLFFVAHGDIFVSRRSSVSESFASATPVGELNSANNDLDPWMSPDGSTFYFSSDRGGSVQIYVATVLPQSP